MRLEYFQLIDRIVDLDLGAKTIKVEAVVPTANTIFEGHFPGFQIMPGVLLVEAMAQTSGWLLVGLNRFERMPFFAAIKDAKFRHFVNPGERIDLTARVIHEGSGYAMTQAAITVDGKPRSSAQLTLVLAPFPNPELRSHMEDMARRVEFPQHAMVQN